MPEHRGERRVPWWRLRRAYDTLRREQAVLERRYRALEADCAVLVGDLEELRPRPERRVPERPVPGWARTSEETPLDPALAATLVMDAGLLESPSGSLGRAEGTTG